MFRTFALALILGAAAPAQTLETPPVGVGTEAQPAARQPAVKITAVVAADTPYRPLTAEQRWKYYFRHTYFSPLPYARALGAGLEAQLDSRPPEWRQGVKGYSQRSASALAVFTVADTYEAAAAAALGQEVRYVRCRCSGLGRRLGYAIAASLFTRNREGRIVPAVARIGGAFGAEYTARSWLPQGYQSDSRIARNILFQTGYRGAVNALREFTPELKRILHRK